MFGSIKKPSRLGQWNGRRHSSRNGEPVLARLRERSVLLRLACVLLTAVGTAWLANAVPISLPYRVGEVCSSDLCARVQFEVINQRYEHGTLLVQHGRPINDQQLTLLQAEHRAYRHSLGQSWRVRHVTAMLLVMGVLSVLVVLYVLRFQPALGQSLAKTAAIGFLVVSTLALGLLLSQPPWHAGVIPMTVTAPHHDASLRAAVRAPFILQPALAMTVALGMDLDHLLVQMSGLATAVLLLRDVRTRTRLVEVGLAAGLAFLIMTVATGLLSGQTASFIALGAGRHFVWGTLAGFLVSGSLPMIERCFGIITDVRLLDLADGSHPLLQELLRRAPGTYTHSMTVATLAEAAAEAIGANPLLTRVGSYFHYLGKMLKPSYFIENQNGENRHDGREPALSTLIIISHVKDGVALMDQYGLPRPVTDFVKQHHGTTLVEGLLSRGGPAGCRLALGRNSQNGTEPKMQAEIPTLPALSQSSFRYPGPKPQNRDRTASSCSRTLPRVQAGPCPSRRPAACASSFTNYS